jgi:hypothetical protein
MRDISESMGFCREPSRVPPHPALSAHCAPEPEWRLSSRRVWAVGKPPLRENGAFDIRETEMIFGNRLLLDGIAPGGNSQSD